MLEKTVETYLVDRVRAAGGDAYKFSSPARVSVPDRIVVFPPARIYFVELKRPGGKLTRGQEREHARLRALGCDVRTLDSREAVDAFVREAGAAAAPADERAAFDVRSFEEWLDQQRDADVASVFHEIVARVTQLRAAASPSAGCPDHGLTYWSWRAGTPSPNGYKCRLCGWWPATPAPSPADERAALPQIPDLVKATAWLTVCLRTELSRFDDNTHKALDEVEAQLCCVRAITNGAIDYEAMVDARAASANETGAADRESVIAEILCKLDGLIKKGPLDEPAHSERNGLVLAFNAVWQLSTEQPAAAPTARPDPTGFDNVRSAVEQGLWAADMGLTDDAWQNIEAILAEQARVDAIKADERAAPNPATAAILFALSLDDGSSIDFLNNWNEGEFDVLRREWPEAPEDVYIGADPFHPATRGGAV
ncbi:PDDEXK family nuclease [Burkholderia cenocepacia]|nr:hypothetical protein [Burkholderia cenocepacia]MCW5155594.1 hypothetical protein [Burkholderia cenocepacia]MCW5161809.1 hypothetical protein [Burkholderia cenocepacia]MCW5171032.1 hypothetical protein [Burkholderia cenocepacia]